MTQHPDVRTVLFIVDGLGLSGKTKSLVELACGLNRDRYRAVVCRFDAESGPLAEQLRDAGVPVHEIPCQEGFNLAVIRRLVQLMRQLRPDVVHCYNPRPMLYGGVAARLAGVRHAIGSLSAFACQVPDRQYGFLPQQLFTTTRRNRLRNRASCHLMRYLVSVSPTLGERFCRYNKLPLRKLRIVPYAISLDAPWRYTDEDVAAFRTQVGAREGDLIVSSVGRLVEQKDYPTQFEAFALALKTAPAMRMVLAGGGPLREALEQRARELGIADRVHFLGHWERVALLLRASDVFAMTSQFEPYGVALLEAKAAGLPIVATAVNEVPEIAPDGECGILVPPKSPGPLAEAFGRMARDADLRRRLGATCLRQARERHDLRHTLEQYQSLYDEIRTPAPRRSRPVTGAIAGVHA
jgi:glycosyltransferase involved in cell wall biosynthesis